MRKDTKEPILKEPKTDNCMFCKWTSDVWAWDRIDIDEPIIHELKADIIFDTEVLLYSESPFAPRTWYRTERPEFI
jgi:hypothetical protein